MKFSTELKNSEACHMVDLCSSLEAILFAAGEPVPTARISLVLDAAESDIFTAAEELNSQYLKNGHCLRILTMSDKMQLCTAPEFNQIIIKILEQRKPPALSQSALEALAIVAYFQPVTTAYINKVRGVDSSYTIGSLADKGLIEIKGKLDAPGRPSLYGTTDLFLRTMSISQLNELPPLPDLAESDAVQKIREAIDALQMNTPVQLAIEDMQHEPETKDRPSQT